MYRISLSYRPAVRIGEGWAREWFVQKCWNVNGDWASRPVRVKRKRRDQVRLQLLCPEPYTEGRPGNPRAILSTYLSAIPADVKVRMANEGVL